ncbi:MAG: thiamine-phosphate pyrophosphorylase, partial [Glaciecola sp.]
TNLEAVIATDVAGVALVSAICDAKSPQDVARKFRTLMRR